jgi:hypothetical protein
MSESKNDPENAKILALGEHSPDSVTPTANTAPQAAARWFTHR